MLLQREYSGLHGHWRWPMQFSIVPLICPSPIGYPLRTAALVLRGFLLRHRFWDKSEQNVEALFKINRCGTNRNPGVSSHSGVCGSAGSFHRLNTTNSTDELRVCLCAGAWRPQRPIMRVRHHRALAPQPSTGCLIISHTCLHLHGSRNSAQHIKLKMHVGLCLCVPWLSPPGAGCFSTRARWKSLLPQRRWRSNTTWIQWVMRAAHQYFRTQWHCQHILKVA